MFKAAVYSIGGTSWD